MVEMPPLGMRSEDRGQVNYGKVELTTWIHYRWELGLMSLSLVKLLAVEKCWMYGRVPQLLMWSWMNHRPCWVLGCFLCEIEVDNLEVPSSFKVLILCQPSWHKQQSIPSFWSHKHGTWSFLSILCVLQLSYQHYLPNPRGRFLECQQDPLI